MTTSKILININNLSEIAEYEKIGINNFLFAVQDFSIGYKAFALDDIPHSSYLLINRVLDMDGINALKALKTKLCAYRGIFFEDIGVYQIFKDEDISLFWYQNHFGTNSNSLNFWLDRGCTSAVISNELTESEIKEIIAKTHQPLVLTVFAKNQIMYSRRTLLTNFNTYNNLAAYNDVTLTEPHTNNVFLARESSYGTALFNNEYFNYIAFSQTLPGDKIKYYLIMNMDLEVSQIAEIISGKDYGNTGFLNKKTVYRMAEYDDRR